jgi:hypothetical protein
VPSPRQYVELLALVPEFKLATGKFPATPVESGNPVAFVSVPPDGVPNAPPLMTGAPAVPTLTPRAVAMPVPRLPMMLGVIVVGTAAPAEPG